NPSAPSPLVGRLLIVTAALLWSLSGAFSNVLSEPTRLGLHQPKLDSIQIAAARVLFAGLFMLPMVRPRHGPFRWATLLTALTLAPLSAPYVTALTGCKSANAVLLQYTAPLWLFLVGVLFLGDKADRRGVVSLIAGVAGIGVILVGGWTSGQSPFILMLGLAS